MDVHLWATNSNRCEVLRFCTFDQRGTGNHHVGLLGHVNPIRDDRHITATGNTIAEHAGNLRHAGRR